MTRVSWYILEEMPSKSKTKSDLEVEKSFSLCEFNLNLTAKPIIDVYYTAKTELTLQEKSWMFKFNCEKH